MELNRRLRKNLKKLMGSQTQQIFARRIGIGQASLSRILKGDQDVSLNMIDGICKSLEIDISVLLAPDISKDILHGKVEKDSDLGFLPWNHSDDSKTSESIKSEENQSRDVNIQ